jgi:hypothetical protein
MSAIEKKKNYEAPTKGLDDRYSPIMIDADEAHELTNFIVNDRGILDKVNGFQKDSSPFPNSTDSFIRMLVNYKRGATVDKLIMAAQDNGNTNTTYKVDYKYTVGDGNSTYLGHTAGTNASFTNGNTAVVGVGTTWLSHLKAGDKIKASSHADDKYTEIASVTNNTNLVLVGGGYLGATAATVAYTARIITDKSFVPRSIVFNNKCVITNGQDKAMTYDNTTLNLITDTDAPRGKFIEAHKSRVFIASTSANPSNVYWSAVNDETSWDAAAAEPVFPNDNGNIVAIKSFADSLIVLKNNGHIYQIVGDFDDDAVGSPQYIRKIDTPENIGIISERSVVVHTDGLYFLTETGVYKLDPRLFVTKVSYTVENLVESLSFALGPSQNLSYSEDTKVQWDEGTHNGTKATADGILEPYYDAYNITDAWQVDSGCSSAIDSANVLHVAYILNSDHTIIKYKQYAIDGTVTTETAIDESATVSYPAIATSSDGTLIGIVYSVGATNKFIERVSGTWSAATTLHTSNTALANSIVYDSVGTIHVALIIDDGAGNGSLYLNRTSGTWSTAVDPGLAAGIGPTQRGHRMSICVLVNASNNPRVVSSVTVGQTGETIPRDIGNTSARKSDDGGATWASAGTASATDNTYTYALGAKVEADVDGSGNLFLAWVGCNLFTLNPTGLIIKQVTANTESKSADTTAFLNGYQYCISGLGHTHFQINSLTTPKEKFFYSNFASNIVNASQTGITTYITGNKAVNKRGQVLSVVLWGVNTDEIVVRRIALSSIYTSDDNSDATLTAWGTYDVSGQTNNSATVLHEVAIDSTPAPSSFVTITNGSVVSTDAAKVHIINRVTFSLGAFAQPSIESIVINYTGAGVDAKQPVAISFDNELYLACSKTTDTQNNQIMFLDIQNVWATLTHPVSSMCRFKTKLYAGKATNGDLIILRETFKFDTSAYTATYVSKEDFLDSIDLEKDIFKIYVLYEVKASGSFDFSYRLDSFKTVGGSTWKTQTIDQTVDGVAEILVGNKAHTIQSMIVNDNLDEDCSVIGFVIVYGYLNQR